MSTLARILLTLAVTVAVAAAVTEPAVVSSRGSNSSSTDPCALLRNESIAAAKAEAAARRQRAVRHTQNVTLVWGSRVAHAAAALLRAALLAAGYGDSPAHLLMLYDTNSARLCDLLDHPPVSPTDNAVVLIPATAWSEWERPCAWNKGSLRVSGAGAAPLGARLLARLPPAAAAAPRCRAAAAWGFYGDADNLRACSFLSSEDTGMNETTNATVYFLDGEWESAEKELRAQWAGSSGGALLRLASKPLSRTELAQRVATSNVSFLFLDAELWADAVLHVASPFALFATSSFRVANEYQLLVHTPALYELFTNMTLPPPSDLRYVLERADGEFRGDVAAAACHIARTQISPVFSEWRHKAKIAVKHKVLVVLCNGDVDFAEYKKMALYVGERIFNSTIELKLGISIISEQINCLNPDRMIADAIELLTRYERNWPARLVGAVVPSGVATATMYAKGFYLPLLAYDVGADAVTTAGRVAHLDLALHRLLGDCEPRRLAIVSESANLNRILPLGVQILKTCHYREITINSNETTIKHALQELKDAGARVFLVNGRSLLAKRVLAAAHALSLTVEQGYAWVVLEYGASNTTIATALRPYSVTFQWCGVPPRADKAGDAQLRTLLKNLWQRRAWPQHAASITNALLTLGKGFKRLVDRHPEMRDSPSTMNKLRYFWNAVREKNISGIVEDLAFDKDGIAAPLVFVQQWGAETKPRHVAEWRAGEPRSPEKCPAPKLLNDSADSCLVLAGDHCNLRCATIAVICYVTAVVACIAGLTLATVLARRAYLNHIARERREVVARLLAGRQRAFAVLASYIINRAALDRREQLGKGHYGRVWLCYLQEGRGYLHEGRRYLHEGNGSRRPRAVAAKELLDDADADEETRFLSEACTLAALQHENVVRFVGVCLADGPPMFLVMEYAMFGDLLRYLRTRRHLVAGACADKADVAAVGREEAAYVSCEALTRFAREAAEALEYLSKNHLVHRDVRASNCLVDERRSLKLADFGLARRTEGFGSGAHEETYTMAGPRMIPARYWPPESLQRGVSSSASDVWSLGVLALELVTLGERPFGSMSLACVCEHVIAGGRPPLPRDASADTRRLAAACWRYDAARRPSAARLAHWLGVKSRALRPALDDADTDSGFGEPPFTEADDLVACEESPSIEADDLFGFGKISDPDSW